MKIRSTTRIALSIGLIGLSLLWISQGLGILPNTNSNRAERRIQLTESIALTTSVILESEDRSQLKLALNRIVARNPDIVSAGFRRRNGVLEVWTTEHEGRSADFERYQKTNDAMKIEMFVKGKAYGDLEITFAQKSGFQRFIDDPNTRLIFFFGSAMILASWFYLGRILRFLNPSRVVPNRVRSALDSLSAGLFLLDSRNRIVVANRSICSILDLKPDQVQGKNPDEFPWMQDGKQLEGFELPWNVCRQTNQIEKDYVLSIFERSEKSRKFQVNANPIINNQNICQGILISFDDVTQLEAKKDDMTKMLRVLRDSRDEIQRTNKTLLTLASSDPLTGCLNRRAFFEHFNRTWHQSGEKEICAIMIDLDHFKSINDNYGHATGDQVLRLASERVRNLIQDKGLFCRYGGEEFSLVLSNISVENTAKIAEKIRVAIESAPIENVFVTASLGVAAKSSGAQDPQHLIDQADQCLYLAKRRGRNQVIRFDLCDRNELKMAEHEEAKRDKNFDEEPRTIHFHAVSALLTSLAYRDKETALHSCRVANLCVAVGKDKMDKESLYELEIAALLHDVGKVGVPDSILLKPEKLDAEEVKIMKLHDQMGVNIVRAACASDRVAEIIEQHHQDFWQLRAQQDGRLPDLPARILPVCDAFDAMVNNRVYRKAMPLKIVFEELRRVSNTQLDPEIVECLIKYVSENPEWSTKPAQAVQLSQRTMIQMGAMVERFTDACQSQDVGQLREITSDIRQKAGDENAIEMVAAAERLESALSQSNADVERLYDMASEMIDLCRSTREFMVDDSAAVERVVSLESAAPNPASYS